MVSGEEKKIMTNTALEAELEDQSRLPLLTSKETDTSQLWEVMDLQTEVVEELEVDLSSIT
jgi:hypothetical protein